MGDVAHGDADGYFTYVGRKDDVFKSADYRLSPFELESTLIEHECIAEAAVVPSADPIRWHVPKAFISLKPGIPPSRDIACEIFRFVCGRLAPYKRIRRIEFSELPKTISGKIRPVELRGIESQLRQDRRPWEYWEEDFPDLSRMRRKRAVSDSLPTCSLCGSKATDLAGLLTSRQQFGTNREGPDKRFALTGKPDKSVPVQLPVLLRGEFLGATQSAQFGYCDLLDSRKMSRTSTSSMTVIARTPGVKYTPAKRKE